MNVNDTNNTSGKLERQWELLETADIDERDRHAIRTFVRVQRQGNEGRADNTLYQDLSVLRNASKTAAVALVDMDAADLRDFWVTLTAPKEQGGRGLAPDGSGIYNYKRGLRVFFQWLNEQPDYGDFEFYENIEMPSQSINRVEEDEMLTADEVEAMKQAANNSRDRTFIAFLADTAARVSLASQLRIGDIYELDTDRPYFKPNPNGIGHKGAPDKRYPILRSSAELRTWVHSLHPDPRDGSPLWPVLRGYDEENPQECAVSSDCLRDMLRRCARQADIDKSVTPHSFRHAAITRLSREGYTPQEIQHLAGWADDRMLEKYDHTTAQQRNEQIRLRGGFIDESEAETEPTRPKTCGNCREKLSPSALFCPRCGSPTTREAEEAIEAQDDRIFESAALADGELVEAVLDLRRLFDEYPQLRTATTES